MDALARIAPVAGRLMDEVDDALASLGAPPEHPVWTLLRRVGVTPADALSSLVDTDPGALRAAGAALRAEAEGYAAAGIPMDVEWRGTAGDEYVARAQALAGHLDDMARRLEATASYVEAVADWQEASRSGMARALAEVLGSGPAVTMRSASPARLEVVLAAADIGAHVLRAAASALAEGEALPTSRTASLAELPYSAPAPSPGRTGVSIDVHL